MRPTSTHRHSQPASPQHSSSQQQHTPGQGDAPGNIPKDAWGYYAPTYDPATDPWHPEEDDPPTAADGPYHHAAVTQQQGALTYNIPPAANRATP